jgi:hypothetical protein
VDNEEDTMGSTHRHVVVAGSFGVLLLAMAAMGCGDDQDALGSVEEWCAQVEEIDAQFEATDLSSDPFEVKQREYAEINAALDELTDAIDLVPSDQRAAVGAAVTFATEFTDVIVGAESEEQAGELLFGEESVVAGEQDLDPAGAAWILDTCGVDINGDESG